MKNKMETNSFKKCCRICLSTLFKSGINLFSEESKKLYLHAKIQRYLSFTIKFDDKLSKLICNRCCQKLEEFHKFAINVRKNQDTLSNYLFLSSPTSPSSSSPSSTSLPSSSSSSSITTQEKLTETKSLLHTYLTKGIKEIEPECEITTMEVRIDPMLILQCSIENDINDNDGNINENKEENCSSPLLSSSSSSSSSFDNQNVIENENCDNLMNSEYFQNQFLKLQSKKVLNSNDNWNFNRETEDYNLFNSNDKNDDNNSDDEKEFKKTIISCPICGKDVSQNINFKVHLESHRPKGKFGCDICGRIFKTQCNLYRHKEYHDGIQFPCSVCGRVYPTNSTLRAHSITHSDLRPHKCPVCIKTFKRNQDLKFHINQHTGARPYKCPYCPKAFASSGNCFSHRKRMHPIEVERDKARVARIMR